MSVAYIWVNALGDSVSKDHLCGVNDAFFIGSEIYRDSTYGRGHPLAIPRVSLAIDLMRALGWFGDGQYLNSPQADADYLSYFHTPEYVRAVINAERDQDATPQVRQRHNIGINGNPIFREMFRRPATAAGGGGLAAEIVRDGGLAYNLGGGQHHGQPDRASGFCYFNEPVLTIHRLLQQGCERIFYLDLDAHQGDGVQNAFHDDDRVFTLSIHEEGRWPMRRDGGPHDPGGLRDRAGGLARNIPVPQGFHDDELAAVMDGAVLPLISDFAPDAIFIQGGVDALEDDPQSKLALSNRALWRAIGSVIPCAPRIILSGGGGYNPYSLARCWSGMWAVLAGIEIPAVLPPEASKLLQDIRWHHRRGRDVPDRLIFSLADPPKGGPIRAEIRTLIRETVSPS